MIDRDMDFQYYIWRRRFESYERLRALSSQKFPRHPLVEVFGYRYDDFSDGAVEHRRNRLCPYNNKIAKCTKDKKANPLGVCSIFDNRTGDLAVICPIRLREDWLIIKHAAEFFFPAGAKWTFLPEIRLKDAGGKSAGNIDIVLVSLDDRGKILDFGALEVQSVYISGNIRNPYEAYIAHPEEKHNMDWADQPNYPRPDYLSSSRKRLLPQLVYKGKILQTWGKKIAVVIHTGFYATLPELSTVPREKADIAWLVYDLFFESETGRYELRRSRTVYTPFEAALTTITTSSAGSMEGFKKSLQAKLDAL